MAALTPSPAVAADIVIILDQAKLVKMPDKVATIVIGNPLIADASVQTGGLMVLTGKGYGATNIIALDRAGAVLMEKTVEVQGPRNVMVVYRGIERETCDCAPEVREADHPGRRDSLLRCRDRSDRDPQWRRPRPQPA